MANELLAALGKILTGVSNTQAAEPQPMPFPMVDAQKGARVLPPMVLPPNGPMPQPRPQLPGGTFTPNRQALPQQGPVPQPRPQMPQMPVQTAPPAQPGQSAQPNPLAALLGGGRDWRSMLAAAGAGMAAIDPRNDDPFSTFGNSLAKSMGYYTDQAEKDRLQALEADKMQYERGQDAQANSRADAELELRRAAEARAEKAAGYANQKSEIEIKRLAKANGVTPETYLDAREKARKEVMGNGDLGVLDGEDVGQRIEQRTEEILRGAGYKTGLSDKGGLSSGDMTATNPKTGERVRYDAATQQWVPMQ